MSPEKVAAILGPPKAIIPGSPLTEQREEVVLGYSEDGQLQEIVFWPKSRLVFAGCNLFADPDPIEFLTSFDAAHEFVGFILFVQLGLRLSGFHDEDEAQKAISVVEVGHWDKYRTEMKLFKARKVVP